MSLDNHILHLINEQTKGLAFKVLELESNIEALHSEVHLLAERIRKLEATPQKQPIRPAARRSE